MPAHFFLPCEHTPQPGQALELDAERSNYLIKVMRLSPGAQIAGFDGRGTRLQCRLDSTRAKRALLTIEAADFEPPPQYASHLGLGVLKGAAMDRSIQLATECGATQISLVFSRHSNVNLSGPRLAAKQTHWHKVAIAAAEQSQRAYVPEIQVLSQWDTLCTDASVYLDIGGVRLGGLSLDEKSVFLIGPEGGWHEDERALFAAHDLPGVGLGSAVLRAETMPASLLAVLDYVRG